MKSAHLSYHDTFPWRPLSGWCGARAAGWVIKKTTSGQIRRPQRTPHPFAQQRKKWCMLSVTFHVFHMDFVTPQELDHFLEIIGKNPLPSGGSLLAGRRTPGRPNNHWLSRMPKHTHTFKFRTALIKYIQSLPEIKEFRQFYASQPVQYEFEGFYDDFYDALSAIKTN